MGRLITLLLLVVIGAAAARHFPSRRTARPSFLRTAERARQRTEVAKEAHNPAPQQFTFAQRLDHFRRDSGKTWSQRYWIDTTFYNPNLPGPLFVQGGEEAEASAGLLGLAFRDYAQEHSALLAVVEHRFYGESQPTGSLADLSLLSVDQGLADYVAVIESLKKQYNTTASVFFGCSYIGAGAAWVRAKYPHAIVGAVASSAPVRAEADFFQYLDQVEQSISERFGAACDAGIRKAYGEVVEMVSKQDPQLKALFGLCEVPSKKEDVATFVSDLMGEVMTVVQYNAELPHNNIDYMCGIIMNASSPLVGLSTFFLSSSGAGSGQCLDTSYAAMVAQLANTTANPADNMRPWVYQTCTEFGYFQTTTSPNQPFAQADLVPLAYYEQLCQDAFGGAAFDVAANVADTNLRMGGNQLPSTWSTNVAWDNSILDPWHTLSVQSAPNPDSPLFLYGVRGHCAAVSPPNPSDPQSIKDVRVNVAKQINKWVAE